MTDLMTHIRTLNEQTRKWVAESEGRWATTLVEDSDHWAEHGVYTVAQFDRYMEEQEIWDLYKEVHGVRPRHLDMASMTDQQITDTLLDLRDLSDEMVAAERRQAELAAESFESLLGEMVEMGAGDRETALRWLIEAREGQDRSRDFIEYEHNLPYGYLSR